MTARRIQVRLEKWGVSCKAELLEDLAPKTCSLLWEALPQGSDAFPRQVRQQRGLHPRSPVCARRARSGESHNDADRR